VSLAATFRSDTFNLLARVDTAFGATDSSNTTYPGEVMTRGFNMVAYIVPSLKLGDETVGLDFGFEFEQYDLRNDFRDPDGKETDQMKMGAALWLSRNLGGIDFKIAAVTRFPLPYGAGNDSGTTVYDNGMPLYWTGGKQAFELMFPLMISASF
jgi:hypothetical protein